MSFVLQTIVFFSGLTSRGDGFFLTSRLISSNGAPALLPLRFGFGKIPRRMKTSLMTFSFSPLLRFLNGNQGMHAIFKSGVPFKQKMMSYHELCRRVASHGGAQFP